MVAPRVRAVVTAKDVEHAAKAVAKDAIAVADALDVVANAAVNVAANASVLMPKENRWQQARTPRAWV